MDEIQKLKETINELSLETIQADAVILRLVSAAKHMLLRCTSLQPDEREAIRSAIWGGEGHLGEAVPRGELVENYRKIER